MPTEKIEVRYKPLGGGAHHKYIIYTDSSGNQKIARGGPTYDVTIIGDGIGAQDFGPVKTTTGDFDSSFTEHPLNRPNMQGPDPSETIMTGSDLSAYFALIAASMSTINAAGYDYQPMSQNSNSVVDQALNDAGLPPAQLDDVYNSPGTDAPLQELEEDLDQDHDGRRDSPELFGPFLPEKPNQESDQGSPLVLDLDGDGIEVYAKGDYGTYFDLRGNGQAVLTGWVAPDDGLLALDINQNGVIDNASELFGNLTTDGFSVLATHDSNGDGVINASDTVFNDLLVWTDLNSDGLSQEDELHTLAELEITAINLAATRVGNENMNGNTVTHESSFTMDGNTRDMADVWFSYDSRVTQNVQDIELDERVFYLPTLQGSGDLKNLHLAASLDNGSSPDSLIERLSALTAETTLIDALSDWATFKTDIEALLFCWASIENVSPTGRGSYVNGQHLAFNEAVRGEDFNQYGQANPLPEAGKYSEAVFEYLSTFYSIQLLTQISGAQIFEAPNYNLHKGITTGDLTLLQDGIDAIETAAIAATEPAEVWAHFAQFIGYTKGLDNLSIGEIAALDAAVYATNEPGLDVWQDVVNLMTSSLGSIIDSADDWGSFEITYDNYTAGTSGADTITDTNAGGFHNNEFNGLDGNDVINGLLVWIHNSDANLREASILN